MTSEIMTATSNALSTGNISPFASQTLFWRARFLCDSPFLHHLSSLFWIIEALRPAVAVEIGVSDGASYFATCQAMDKLVQSPRCHGLGVWPSDTPPAAIQSYNDQQYAEFSTLEPYAKAGAADRFESGSIDLLHVDLEVLELSDALVSSLRNDWSRKMSRRGVVVLHGIYKGLEHSATSDFLKTLGKHYPTVSLEAGNGALVVLFGAARNPRLETLASLGHGEAGFSEIHQMLRRLGALHHFEQANRESAEQVQDLTRKLAEAEARLAAQSAPAPSEAQPPAPDAAQLQAQTEIDRLTEALADKEQGIATLTKTFEQETTQSAQLLQQKEEELANLKAEIHALTSQAEHDPGITTLTQAFEAQTAEATARMQERDAEVSALKAEIQTLEQALTSKEQGITTLTETFEEQATQSAQLLQQKEAESVDLKAKIQALEATLANRDQGIITLTQTLEAQTAEAAAQMQERDAERTALKAEVQTLEKTLEDRDHTIADVNQQRDQTVRILTDALEEQTAEALQAQQEQAAATSPLQAEVDRLTEALADSEKNFTELNQSLETRGGALAVVSAQSQQWQQALQAKKSEASALKKETEALRTNVTALKKQVRHLEKERTELLNSTSWKLTAPARKILGRSRNTPK
jgi:DNA repair exonuclease SbcCD ATPase subunit